MEPGGRGRSSDDAVRGYIDAIAPEHRPLFDRLHRVILAARPDAAVAISYTMPTYRIGNRRLHLGVRRHGVSLYGWRQGCDGGFTTRHPELQTGKEPSGFAPRTPLPSTMTSYAVSDAVGAERLNREPERQSPEPAVSRPSW